MIDPEALFDAFLQIIAEILSIIIMIGVVAVITVFMITIYNSYSIEAFIAAIIILGCVSLRFVYLYFKLKEDRYY